MPPSPSQINSVPQQPAMKSGTVPRDLATRMVKLSLEKQKKLSASKTSRLLTYTLNKNHCSRIRKKVENHRMAKRSQKAPAAPRNSEVDKMPQLIPPATIYPKVLKPSKNPQPIPLVMPNPIPVPRVLPNPIRPLSNRPTWLSPLFPISSCPTMFPSQFNFPPGYVVLPNPIRKR